MKSQGGRGRVLRFAVTGALLGGAGVGCTSKDPPRTNVAHEGDETPAGDAKTVNVAREAEDPPEPTPDEVVNTAPQPEPEDVEPIHPNEAPEPEPEPDHVNVAKQPEPEPEPKHVNVRKEPDPPKPTMKVNPGPQKAP